MKRDVIGFVNQSEKKSGLRLDPPRAAVAAIGSGSLRPARSCERQRTAIAIAIPNSSAAACVVVPCRIAAKTRCRRSIDKARAIAASLPVNSLNHKPKPDSTHLENALANAVHHTEPMPLAICVGAVCVHIGVPVISS